MPPLHSPRTLLPTATWVRNAPEYGPPPLKLGEAAYMLDRSRQYKYLLYFVGKVARHARERAERRAAEMLPNDVDRGRVLKACEHFDETHTRRLKAAETLRGMAELLTAERDAARLGGEGARSGQPAADEALITRIKPLLAAGEQLRKLGDLRTRDIEREGIPRQHLGIRLLERPAVASVFAPLDLDDEWDAAMRDRVELTHSEPRAVGR